MDIFRNDLVVYCPTIGIMNACISLFIKYGLETDVDWGNVFKTTDDLCLRFDERSKRIRFSEKKYYKENHFEVLTYTNDLEMILKERIGMI